MASSMWMVLGCLQTDVPSVPEAEPQGELVEPAPVARLWAEIPVTGDPTGQDMRLFWPAEPSWPTILVQREDVATDMISETVPWTDPLPSDPSAVVSGGLVAKEDLAEIRRRISAAGAPVAIPPRLVEIPLRVLSDPPLGRVQMTFMGSGPGPGEIDREAQLAKELGIPPERRRTRGRWSSMTSCWLVGFDGEKGTIATGAHDGHLSEVLASADFAMIQPENQPDEGILEIDASVSEGIEEGDPVRLVWPEGAVDVSEDVAEAAFAYAGRTESGKAKIRAMRYLAHIQSMRIIARQPPTLVRDERVPLTIPLKSTPNPDKMAQIADVTDGRYRSPSFPYLAVGDRSITFLVPPEDVEWMRHWVAVSGGRLSLSKLRGIDISGGAPTPPGFPPNTRLRQ